uniref:NARG2_C domain-containing protein n=1 Tax=Parastrongyloides trichosuri TaxID=131310 RepID=A0A0N4Z7B4_PARTI
MDTQSRAIKNPGMNSSNNPQNDKIQQQLRNNDLEQNKSNDVINSTLKPFPYPRRSKEKQSEVFRFSPFIQNQVPNQFEFASLDDSVFINESDNNSPDSIFLRYNNRNLKCYEVCLGHILKRISSDEFIKPNIYYTNKRSYSVFTGEKFHDQSYTPVEERILRDIIYRYDLFVENLLVSRLSLLRKKYLKAAVENDENSSFENYSISIFSSTGGSNSETSSGFGENNSYEIDEELGETSSDSSNESSECYTSNDESSSEEETLSVIVKRACSRSMNIVGSVRTFENELLLFPCDQRKIFDQIKEAFIRWRLTYDNHSGIVIPWDKIRTLREHNNCNVQVRWFRKNISLSFLGNNFNVEVFTAGKGTSMYEGSNNGYTTLSSLPQVPINEGWVPIQPNSLAYMKACAIRKKYGGLQFVVISPSTEEDSLKFMPNNFLTNLSTFIHKSEVMLSVMISEKFVNYYKLDLNDRNVIESLKFTVV